MLWLCESECERKIKTNPSLVIFCWEGRCFLWASGAASRDFPQASPLENFLVHPTQPPENTVHLSSFTRINPVYGGCELKLCPMNFWIKVASIKELHG